MKKLLLAVAVTGFCLGAANAFAVTPYVSLGGGAVWLTDADIVDTGFLNPSISFENGWVVRGAAGVALNKYVRLEAEGFYTTSDVDNASLPRFAPAEIRFTSVAATGALINAYYDINFGSPFVPYVSAGLGGANVEVERKDRTADETGLAYAFGAGAAYAFNNNFSLDLSYRYFATEDLEFDYLDLSYASHQVLLGARFSF
jgi:opacity protein-like surface antigen